MIQNNRVVTTAFLFALGIFTTSSSFALTLSGQAFIQGTRDPLTGVSAFLLPVKKKAATDASGQFRFEEVAAGEYQVIINAPGFIKLEQAVTLSTDTELKLYVARASEYVFETTIEASDQKDVVQRKVTKKYAQSLPGAGADPIRAVQNIPGVNRTQGFSSQVIIQGSAPQDTRYTIDGHEVPLIFHFGGLSSVFNPDLTESFDFLSAGYQSNYGRAMGGILNLNSRNVDSKRLKGSAFIDTFNSGALVEFPVGEESYLAAGVRVSYIGQVLKAIAEENEDFSLSVAPSYQDVSAVYATRISPNVRFKLSAIGSQDSLEFIAKNPLGNDPGLRGSFSNKVGFFRLFPQWEWTHSNRSLSKISFGIGRDFINTNISDQYFELKTWTATIRAENRNILNDQWTLVTGMDHVLALADVSFKLPVFSGEGGVFTPFSTAETRVATQKGVRADSYAIYANPIYKPVIDSLWTFYPGLRVDYFAPLNEAVVQPRLGARYLVAPTWTLLSAGGLYAQAPEEFQYSDTYGNPDLNSQKSWHLRVGAEKDLSSEVSRGSDFSTGVFARWFRDLVISDVSDAFTNGGRGKAFGLENSLKLKFDPWDFWLSYTLSRSTREDDQNPEYLYQYDQTHFLTLIAGVNLPRNWRISGRFRYVTGPLDTQVTSAVQDLDNNVFIPIRGGLYNVRLDAFTQLDLRIDKRWIYDTWTLSLYLDIQNVLNRQNVEAIQYSYDYRTTENVTGIPILPIFGLKGEF